MPHFLFFLLFFIPILLPAAPGRRGSVAEASRNRFPSVLKTYDFYHRSSGKSGSSNPETFESTERNRPRAPRPPLPQLPPQPQQKPQPQGRLPEKTEEKTPLPAEKDPSSTLLQQDTERKRNQQKENAIQTEILTMEQFQPPQPNLEQYEIYKKLTAPTGNE